MSRLTLRRSDAGASLPEVMVAIMINALVLGSIATGIIMFTMWQSSVVDASRDLAVLTGVEAQLRGETATATAISTDGDTLVVESWKTGECVEQRWHLDEGWLTKSSATCGETLFVHQPMMIATEFTVAALNTAGRAMSITDGEVTLATETPATPTPADWDSTRVGAAVVTVDGTEFVLPTGPATRLAGFPQFPTMFGGAQ